ncbi:MAG: COX15/CtaA family protein [Acidobacteriota bacterium]|nr:COX15/CtaA family protein [Acidobacteriota bacterium]
MRARLVVTEDQFRKATYLALASLVLIVFTGAIVRLTDSGLGCNTWPRCDGSIYPPDQFHSVIEFGNRVVTVVVSVISFAIFAMAFMRRPFRRDLAWISLALPLGIVAQAFLGGYTVLYKLAPGFVMGHFLLSMLVIVFSFWLAWRATFAQGARPRNRDRALVYSVRALAILCWITLFAGTAATAAGPHSGGHVGQVIKRLTIEGAGTLEWAVHQHATIAAVFGVCVILVWLFKRKRTGGALDPLEPLTVLGVLLAAQGLLGSVQYELKLPGEMVWLHVSLATVTWVVMLWAVATEGRVADPAELEPDASIDTIVAEWSRSVPAS